MRLFIGLGNPGAEYHETRHNVGFRVIDRLADLWGLSLKKPLFKKYEIAFHRQGPDQSILLKPLTYMNLSGTVLPGVMKRWDITPDRVFVLCDNMDLAPGEIRVKRKGSAGGHNGLTSIIKSLGTGDFNRVYIGIGRPSDSSRVVPHVLGVPEPEEAQKISAGEDRAKDAILSLESISLDKVINEYNRRNPS